MMGRVFFGTLVATGVLGAGMVSGCGGAPPATEAPRVGANPTDSIGIYLARSCDRSHPGVGPRREGTVRQGSSVALARGASGLVAYVADHDRRRLAVVDVATKKVDAFVPLYGAPEQVEVLGDGRVVVAIGGARHLEAFEPTTDRHTPLQRLCARELPAGPFALASSPDDRTLAVTSAWEPSLTLLDASLSPKSSTPLPRAPRGVLVDEHNHAFVSHLVGGNLSVVDLAFPMHSPKSISLSLKAGSPLGPEAALDVQRGGSQAYALVSVDIQAPPSTQPPSLLGEGRPLTGTAPSPVVVVPPKRPRTRVDPPRAPPPSPAPPAMVLPRPMPRETTTRIIVPMVSVDSGDRDRPGQSYYGPPPIAGVPKQAPVAVVVDPLSETSLTSHVLATTGAQRGGECVLPRAIASHPKQELLYVTCLGIDELLELDARSADPMHTVRRRFVVPAGPTGVAIAGKEDLAIVFSQFDAALSLVPLDGSRAEAITLTGGDIPEDSIASNASAMRGRALFYKGDDHRITGDGLACSSCHPDGTEDGLTWFTPDGPRQTPMLAGRLPRTQPFGWTRGETTLESYISGTCSRLGGTGLPSEELSELAAYVRTMPAPPRNTLYRPDLVARGKEVFEGRGCSSCHVGAIGTDAKIHAFLSSEAIDTPSLKDVGLTAPYFHDGRYRSLAELLSDPNSGMGSVAVLSQTEREAIVAYLSSL